MKLMCFILSNYNWKYFILLRKGLSQPLFIFVLSIENNEVIEKSVIFIVYNKLHLKDTWFV